MWQEMLAQTRRVSRSGDNHPRSAGGRGHVGRNVAHSLLAAIMVAGCASTVVKSEYESAKLHLQRPSQIFVYNFAVTRAQVKENQGLLQSTVNDFKGETTRSEERRVGKE